MWRRILQSGKAIAFLPSLSLFVGAVFLGCYGTYILLETLYKAFTDETTRDSTILAIKLISVMDIHLLSVILYIFAVGLYELLVGKLQVPEWLKIENIDQLKSKLASVIVLILAVTFTKEICRVEKLSGYSPLWFGSICSYRGAYLLL